MEHRIDNVEDMARVRITNWKIAGFDRRGWLGELRCNENRGICRRREGLEEILTVRRSGRIGTARRLDDLEDLANCMINDKISHKVGGLERLDDLAQLHAVVHEVTGIRKSAPGYHAFTHPAIQSHSHQTMHKTWFRA